MKPRFTLVCLFTAISLLACLFLSPPANAQYAPGLPAGFGIDGDVLSGQSQNISGNTPQGSFDWFRKNGAGANVGVGVIDTTGTSGYATQVLVGQNFTFTQGMAFSRYSANNGYLLLDARYARDHYGLSNAPGKSDLTTYTSGAKNGDNPTSWITTPAGGTVADKADIIDTYIHMRRNGTLINNTNPSPLILAMGISTVGNTGNRYVDFELFRSRIDYNQSTGNFSNSGSVSTGGHTAWQFNGNGTVKDIGDISVSFSFGTLGVTEISVYIWVSQVEFSTITPSNFNFTAGEFYGSSTYGYAKVTPKSANAFQAWGTASSSNTSAAPWGTNSKTNGGSPTNYGASSYAALDFAEVAIDLTSLGVDPALSVGMDPCVPPYTRVIAKSRSSASYTSSLQDFTGPYEFLDAPMASPQIAEPANLKCNSTTVTLSPAVPVAGAVYQWSTTNGRIISDPNANSVTVDKAGKYYLTSAIVEGCPTRKDSTDVTADYYKPVATATVTGLLTSSPLSFVSLKGGDVAASNFATPYGGSVGLDWKWTGPLGYVANIRNPTTVIPGSYTLELTEQRNGCKDVAIVPVAAAGVLPVTYTSFTAEVVDNKSVTLKWTTANETINSHFEVERSFGDNAGFRKIALIAEGGVINNGQHSYQYNDVSNELKGQKIIFYRLKQVDLDGKATYSEVLAVKITSKNDGSLQVFPNPFADKLELRFSVSVNALAEIRIVSYTGKVILINRTRVNKGPVQVKVGGLDQLKPGAYIAQLVIDGTIIESQKVIKE